MFNRALNNSNRQTVGKKQVRDVYELAAFIIKSAGIHRRIQINRLKKQTVIQILRDLSSEDSEGISLTSLKLMEALQQKERFELIKKTTGSKSESISYEENFNIICHLPSEKFYQTREWRGLRYKVIRESDRRCQCCGASAENGAELHVDHIKPRSIYPELSLSQDNLQVLCSECNKGKSNVFFDDWRKK